MAKQPRKGKMKDAAEVMRGLVNDIRGDMGLPPLPQALPLASTIWQGRTVASAFEQLKHEAHYCLLSFLIDSAAEVEEYRRKQYRRLKGYRPELNDYMSTLGNQRRELSGQWYHAGGSPHYGLTLTNPGAKSGHLTQRWVRWIEDFAEEVRAAFVAHGQGEQAAKEVGRLASGIAKLSIGNAERTAYEARLELARQDLSNRGQYAAPGDIAAMFQGHIEGFNTWRVRLVERVGAVVATTTTTKPKPAKEWPGLKSLALYHAYRHEAGDGSADINKANCEQVATAGGYTAKSSGKELLTHFQRYACGEPDNKRIERTKEGKRRGDVLKRLNTVIKKLEDYPEARAMAEDERKAVRARSNKDED